MHAGEWLGKSHWIRLIWAGCVAFASLTRQKLSHFVITGIQCGASYFASQDQSGTVVPWMNGISKGLAILIFESRC